MLHQQWIYARHKFGAQKKLFDSFVLIGKENNGKEEALTEKKLPLSSCLMTGEDEES